MTKENITSIKQKIHWFILPLLITLLTWMVITIYSISASVQVIQKGSDYDKEQHQSFSSKQDQILNTAEEARTFSLENNTILTQKADRSDIENIRTRLNSIESKVDKIYNRKGITWLSNIDTVVYSPYYLPIVINNQKIHNGKQ